MRSTTRRIRAALLAFFFAVIASTASIVSFAAPANAVAYDPSCIVSIGNNGSGYISYTVHVLSDPCGRKVRAWVFCSFCFYGNCQRYTRYGNIITAPGSSKASCDSTDNLGNYGHQVYVNNVWVTYQDS